MRSSNQDSGYAEPHLAGFVLFIDFMLLAVFAVQQSDRYFNDSRPSQVVLSVNDGLVSAGAAAEQQGAEREDAASDSTSEAGSGADGSSADENRGAAAEEQGAEDEGAAKASTAAWNLSDDAARTLQDNDAWAFLLDEQPCNCASPDRHSSRASGPSKPRRASWTMT